MMLKFNEYLNSTTTVDKSQKDIKKQSLTLVYYCWFYLIQFTVFFQSKKHTHKNCIQVTKLIDKINGEKWR